MSLACPNCQTRLSSKGLEPGDGVECPKCRCEFDYAEPDSSIVNCPGCRKPLSVDRELANRDLECPHCQTIISYAALQMAHDENPKRYTSSRDYEDDDEEEREYRRERKRRRIERARRIILAPAIALLIIAAIGLLYGGFNLIYNLTGQNEDIKAAEQLKPNDAGFQMGLKFGFIVGSITPVIWAVVIIPGAISMIRLKLLPLAWVSAIMAVLPSSPCCLLGLPIGIWAIIVLMNPEVKRAFS